MTFGLICAKRAERELAQLSPMTALRIMKGCERLMSNPFPDGKHIKKLKGYEGLCRLRVGDYRIVSRTTRNVVEILDIVSKPDFQQSYC